MKKNLTVRYSVLQFSYWAAAMGAASFATTYLLEKGLSSGLVGILLAASGLLACLTQPFMAAYADRAKKYVLPQLMVLLSCLCILCFALQLLPGLPIIVLGILYILGMWISDATHSLINALNIACNKAGYQINFGVARSFGSVSSGLAALALGYIIAKLGTNWMFLFLIAFRLICIFAIIGFPKLEKQLSDPAVQDRSCSIPEFFLRYKWYCLSLLGIGFLGMYHAMTESYMIVIMERLGGNSSNVGTALFISSLCGAPAVFCFSFFHKRMKETSLMKIAALTFLLKSVLFCFAPSIPCIYLFQTLQATSYGFLGPAQVYFAGNRVRPVDMIKGQAFVTAAYSLGCSGGNFVGGQLLNFGVDAMLVSGVVMALMGTIILFFSFQKSDI